MKRKAKHSYVKYALIAAVIAGGVWYIRRQSIPLYVNGDGSTVLPASPTYNPVFGTVPAIVDTLLDKFGISPAMSDLGVPNWQRLQTPTNPNDPVSYNDLGVNFNLFGLNR